MRNEFEGTKNLCVLSVLVVTILIKNSIFAIQSQF